MSYYFAEEKRLALFGNFSIILKVNMSR